MFGNLRLVRTDKLHEYATNTRFFLRVGNAEFGEAMSAGINVTEPSTYPQPWMLYHSWKEQRIFIDDQSAILVQQLMDGTPPGQEHQQIVSNLEKIGWCDEDSEIDLSELFKRTQESFIAIQNEYELKNFLKIVRDRKPGLVVEIGTARGGVLYCLSQLATRDATLVSIDLPGAPNCGGQTAVEREVFATFGPSSQKFHFIPEDSHLDSTVKQLETILQGRKIDLLFIDGDHSYEGCLQDFEMYKKYVSMEGLIIFHDICVFPDIFPGSAVGVAWQELKNRYGGEEIMDPTGVSKSVLEEGEHWRWGIGILRASDVLTSDT